MAPGAAGAPSALLVVAVERSGDPWALGGVLIAVGLVLVAAELAAARARRRIAHAGRRQRHDSTVVRLRVGARP